jgi:hypothetical protein
VRASLGRRRIRIESKITRILDHRCIAGG